MSACFDTNIIVDFLNQRPQALAEIANHDRVFISRIAWAEILVGAKSDDEEAALENFLGFFEVVDTSAVIGRRAAQLRRQHHFKLPDALIYATAQDLGVELVTRNTRDFPSGTKGIRVPYTL